MIFRPTLWLTLFTLPTLAVLIGLGVWQLDRLEWKEDLIALRTARLAEPPLDAAELAGLAAARVDDIEFRPVHMRGRYAGEGSLHLLSRTRDRAPGLHVVAAFRPEGIAGTVLVDRGWVRIEQADSYAPAPEGPVTLNGFVRRFETPGRFTPVNDAAANNWFTIDGAAMAAALDAGPVLPFYVQRAPDPSVGGYPAGGVPAVTLHNPHLQYALTWFGVAVALVAIYVIFHLRRREDAPS